MDKVPPPAELDQLMDLGMGIMLIADMPVLKMAALISTILKHESLAVALASPFMGTNDTETMLAALLTLLDIIPLLPHNNRADFGTAFCIVLMSLCALVLGL